jgi:DNA-binding CsgD family transcriptional regulator
MISAAADRSAELGILDQESIALFDLVRLGAYADVLNRFIEVASRCEGALVATQSLYAQACRDADDSLMSDVSEQFERLGAYLNAAEASARAGVFAQLRGDTRTATKFDRRTLELRQHIDPAVVTPHLERSVGVVPLTEREREISLLVAHGRTSRDIATELHLSVRTVNNHLQNVFSKLGVSSRDDIAQALGIARD